MSHFNQLTPQQAELLAVLSEEAGEIVQAVGKILRHGSTSTYPGVKETNVEALEREIGDLWACVNVMTAAGLLRLDMLHAHTRTKLRAVDANLHHSWVSYDEDTNCVAVEPR